MKYRAPVTDYIPKSSYTKNHFYNVYKSDGFLSDWGYELSTFDNYAYIKGIIENSLYSLNAAYLYLIASDILTGCKCNIENHGAAIGESVETNDEWEANVLIGDTIELELKQVDVISVFSTFTAGDFFRLKFTLSETGDKFTGYIAGLILKYTIS